MGNKFKYKEYYSNLFFEYRWLFYSLAIIITAYVSFLFLSTNEIQLQNQKLTYSKYSRLTGVKLNPSISLVIPDNHKWSRDFLSRIAHEEKTHNLFFNYISNLDNKQYLIIDAGAHVGDTAIWLAKFAQVKGKKIKVLAIDPDTSKIKFINDIVNKNELQDYVITVNSAVGDDFSKASIVKYQTKKSGRVRLHSGAWQVKNDMNGDIDVVPLDHIYSSLKLDDYTLAILHLDVEGSEFKVMQGAIGLILKNHPLCIFELFNKNNTRIKQVMSLLGFNSSGILRHDNNNEIFYMPNDITYKKSLKNLGAK